MPHFRLRSPVEAYRYGYDELPDRKTLCIMDKADYFDGPHVVVLEQVYSRVKRGDYIVRFEGRWKVMHEEDFKRTYLPLDCN